MTNIRGRENDQFTLDSLSFCSIERGTLNGATQEVMHRIPIAGTKYLFRLAGEYIKKS
jgi:hypothetical protein